MKNQSRALRITLVLALALFVGLISYSFQDRNHLQHEFHTEIDYGMDLELKWMAEADAATHKAVQDTFGFYAEQMGLYAGATSSRFQLDELTGMYHLTASMDFAQPDAAQSLLSALVDQGYVVPAGYTYRHGLGHGNLALRLPIPGQADQILHIDGSAFELQLAPRAVLDLSEESPEA